MGRSLFTCICALLLATASWAGDSDDAAAQALCKEVLKREKNDMVMGVYYTEKGRRYVNTFDGVESNNIPSLKTISINGKCAGFLEEIPHPNRAIERLNMFQLYQNPVNSSEYVLFTNIGDILEKWDIPIQIKNLYLLDSNMCEFSEVDTYLTGYSDVDHLYSASYSYYKKDVYAIFRKRLFKVMGDQFDLGDEVWLGIQNLTSKEDVTHECDLIN